MLLLLADANFCFEYTLEGQTMRSNESSEDYLEAILVLSHCKPVVRSVDIADEMVAIKDLRDRLINKHISEHAQVSINNLYRNINED